MLHVGIWQKVAIALSVAAILAATAFPCLAAPLTVENTSTYVGAGRWNWTIFVDADPDTLAQIDCVQYTLHPTFPDPVRKVCRQPETKFALSSNGWGTFKVKVQVQYKDGRIENLEHELVFQRKTAPTSSNVTAESWSRQIEPGWWEWGIHIKGAPADLDRIRCVEYTLHPSFPNPVRLVCSRDNNFQLTARGWGEFKLLIKLIFQDGSIRQMSHQLEFR
jgi:transcription initiation factor IIF auxiliary subunit